MQVYNFNNIIHINNHAFLSTCKIWAAGTNLRVKESSFTLVSHDAACGILNNLEEVQNEFPWNSFWSSSQANYLH
jgi:hypothetical protein